MATSRGKAATLAYIAGTPQRMLPVLRGAARAGGTVFADYIKDNTTSDAVREDVRMRTQIQGDQIKTTVDLKPGWGRSVGNWLEWGTEGHFISVDDEQRRGRSVGRINQQVRAAGGDSSLVIGGQFVGKTVWHPGARGNPVFRPARDLKQGDAIAAAQAHINARVKRSGIVIGDEGEDE